ncbi:LOW QUALITY PROTEIN: hypothetical protein DH2020_026750 [Rehmannia glutinosa]|uniref:Germin-like protein n=1 Tax=Rehmannia glutinosa TaxID=99300 RepID=A0ABR0W0H6_REHGL
MVAAVSKALLMMAVVMLTNRVYADPDALQDICVADLTSAVKVNGYPCKSNVTADDFFFSGIANPGATNNSVGSLVTGANVQRIPGLNTLGVSLARIDYAPGGLNPPHTHPRATELVFVLDGELDVGFITTANVLIAKSIKKETSSPSPKASSTTRRTTVPAAVLSAFNSQLPGTQSIAATLFAAAPVPDNVLTKAFQETPKKTNETLRRGGSPPLQIQEQHRMEAKDPTIKTCEPMTLKKMLERMLDEREKKRQSPCGLVLVPEGVT